VVAGFQLIITGGFWVMTNTADARPVRQQRIGFTQLADDLFRRVMSSLHE
jgi:hypothetical protein